MGKKNTQGEFVLVTGAAGFLGSHLCDKLLASGCSVIGIDDFSTGSASNVSHLVDNPNFELRVQDVTVPLFVEVDAIYNLASPASPPHYQKNPTQTLRTNILGAMNMLELAKQLKVRIFQASTSEVYGDPLIHPQTEGYFGNVNPIGPRACYDESKRVVETLFFDYRRQFDVDIRVARIFNTYGPRMAVDDGRVVSNFIVQALGNESITIFGDGSQTRSFCYVDDLIDGFLTMMHPETVISSPVNLGNPIEFTMLELAKQVIRETDSASELVFQDLPEDDPQRRRPDISLAKDLSWEPKVGLEQGLQKTVAYFRKRVSP
jgi:UDP-glucuronate decarboxylase